MTEEFGNSDNDCSIEESVTNFGQVETNQKIIRASSGLLLNNLVKQSNKRSISH